MPCSRVPGRRAAQTLSKFTPTYAYEFNDPNAPQLFVPPASFPYHAYHALRDPVPVRLPNQTGAPGINGDQEQRSPTRWSATGRSSRGRRAEPVRRCRSGRRYSVANDTYQSLKPPTPEADDRLRRRSQLRVLGREFIVRRGRARSAIAQVNTFTARAITRPRIASEISDCTAIAILAHGASGMASVGLKAVALVTPRYM